MAMARTELLELINFLRSQGVTHYEADGVKLVLGPVDKPLEKEEAAKIVQERDSLFNLTETEQLDMFGVVANTPG